MRPAYARVGEQVGQLLARVRTVAPQVDCMVVSPTDRADAEPEVARMREAMSRPPPCFWFDVAEASSAARERSRGCARRPTRGCRRTASISIKGYRELGRTMFAAMTSGYPQQE